MHKILLADDNSLLRETLAPILQRAEYEVYQAANLKRLFEIVKDHAVDMILLDVHFPDGVSVDSIGDLRAITDAPIFIISGDTDKDKKLEGLRNGADDYIVKPFDFDILLARIEGHIKRYSSSSQPVISDNVAEVVGDWALDALCRTLCYKASYKCAFTSDEFKLVELLLSHSNRPVRRSELINSILEKQRILSERAIDIKITRIRKKINQLVADEGLTGADVIKSVRGVGYMFVNETA